jgi:HlyD family secretion protein
VEEVGEVKCRDSTTVYLEGNGLIRNIYVEENQPVKKGDPLMSMDQAQMDIALQNAQETLSGARAQYAAGEEAYQTALKDYSNTKFLAEEGAASQWELTQKEAALKSAEAVRAAYQSELEQAELALQNSTIALGKQQIVSPIDGTVLEKNVELNELGEPGMAAFVIGNGDDVEIESKILADDAAEIKIGDEAEVIARTEEKQSIRGVVVKIAPTATEEISSLGVKQKKVAVTVRPLDPAISLKVGSEVDVRVITDTKRGVVIVPAGAVFDYQGESCVFTVESGKAVIRPIERGIRNQSFAEIKKGLKEGDAVISAPDNSIEAGMRIKAVFTEL